LAFPVDRRALAGHRDLKLSEAQIRGASRLLEEIGFLEREEAAPGAKHQQTAKGLHRRPILFRFGPDFLELFKSARRALRKPPERRKPTQSSLASIHASPARTFPGPRKGSLGLRDVKSPKNTFDTPTILLMGEVKERLPRQSLPSWDQSRSDSRLEAALKRLAEAIGVKP